MRQLAAAGHPVVTCHSGAALSVGQEFFRWQAATAIAAAVLGVNPFDQPDVEASKARARSLAAAPDGTAGAQTCALLRVQGPLAFHGAPTAAPASFARLAAHRDAGGYVALLAYLPRDADCERWLASARDCVRGGTGAATVGGFGPRYLHSCGQLHKGEPRAACSCSSPPMRRKRWPRRAMAQALAPRRSPRRAPTWKN